MRYGEVWGGGAGELAGTSSGTSAEWSFRFYFILESKGRHSARALRNIVQICRKKNNYNEKINYFVRQNHLCYYVIIAEYNYKQNLYVT